MTMPMRDRQTRRALTLLAALAVAAALFGCAPVRPDPPPRLLNPVLLDLPKGRWVKIHQQHRGDAVTFARQHHGGSAFDTRRGRLVLFGSDTHDAPDGSWLNGPLVFDPVGLEWREAYPADPVSSYRVRADGVPVAGARGYHPWAMHTFGAVAYDASADTVVVASFPAYLEPGRFTDALATVWPRVGRHPTWLWRPQPGLWQALAGDAVHFFAWATAYDPRRKAVLGYRHDGVYALTAADGRWRKLGEGGLLGWGSNVAFDTANDVLIVFGSHLRGNEVAVFDPATGAHRRMPTAGARPAGGAYVPLAFHPGMARTVALIDRPARPDAPSGFAETWLYDYRRDAWARVEAADLPFRIGMNYNLEYDPGHALLLLVATPPGNALPAVWALDLGSAP
jgi:hypothetical protein